MPLGAIEKYTKMQLLLSARIIYIVFMNFWSVKSDKLLAS